MTPNLNVADSPAMVTFLPTTSPAFSLGYYWDCYHGALVARCSSFPYGTAIFLAGPLAIPLSVPRIIETHVVAPRTNVREPFELAA